MDVAVRPPGAVVRVVADVTVAADHPAEVAASVVVVALRLVGEPAGAEQVVVACQVWPASAALLGARDVLPASSGQESMVAARQQPGAVLERDSMARAASSSTCRAQS